MPHAKIEIGLDEGALEAFVACPSGSGRYAPILLLSGREGITRATESRAMRLSAHNFFVLAPDLSGRSAEARREAAWAALDHLEDDPRVDDARVGVLGFGSGADLALVLAAWRAERIAAVAAYGGRGFGPRTAVEIAERINGLIRIGYVVGHVPARAGLLEQALARAGVMFDIEVCEAEPAWSDLVDLFGRVLAPAAARRSLADGARPTTSAL